MFFPACFAEYRALSDLFVTSSGVFSGPYSPKPILTDKSIWSFFHITGELETASTIRSATTVAASSEVLGSITANSSPP